MTESVRRTLFWVPRLIGILFAAFISLFALDVFVEGYRGWEALGALAIHLLPTGIVLLALAIAWRWERAGGALLILLGLLYIAMAWGELPWGTYLIMAGVPMLTGTLFLISGLSRGAGPRSAA